MILRFESDSWGARDTPYIFPCIATLEREKPFSSNTSFQPSAIGDLQLEMYKSHSTRKENEWVEKATRPKEMERQKQNEEISIWEKLQEKQDFMENP